ncbi:uncharacterized protein G2W53_025927 [Senna tora]|uniref:Uncharacterized protein n=1 Tax=Senna tora TaxID=362788 RepID=A0A834TG04_9FABA|nr:uncharacterized protein G2W53_025927 [Senna tora]
MGHKNLVRLESQSEKLARKKNEEWKREIRAVRREKDMGKLSLRAKRRMVIANGERARRRRLIHTIKWLKGRKGQY